MSPSTDLSRRDHWQAGRSRLTTVTPDELLAARYGVFTASEARFFDIGTTQGAQVKAFRMLRSTYSMLPPPWTPEARWTAGVLAGGPGALLFGESLREAFGLAPLSAHRPVEVLTPASTRRMNTGFVLLARTRHPIAAGYGVRGKLVRPLARDIGVAAPELLVAHLGTVYAPTEVRATLATMSQRRLVEVSTVAAWAARNSRVPGARVAAWAAAELAGGLQSEGEVRLHALARVVGMPADEAQLKIWSKGRLVSVTDAFWREGVAGYFDGAVHMDHAVHQKDIAIRERLRTAGLAVLEATNVTLQGRSAFRRTLASRLDQARAGANARHWTLSARGIELDPGF